MGKITFLEEVQFGVPDLEKTKQFFKDWNLHVAKDDPDCGVFQTQEGARIVVKRADDPSLPPPAAPGICLRKMVWGVESAKDLDSVAAILADYTSVSRDSEGNVSVNDPTGYALTFQVSTLKKLPPVEMNVNYPGLPVRVNQPIDGTIRPTIRHLGHIAIFVSDFKESVKFYQDLLKFRPSDLYEERGLFLRSPGSNEHHNLFLVNRDGQRGVHHISFEVQNFHELMQGGIYMEQRGWTTYQGPGRHRLGSNFFWYFNTPYEGTCELYSDMDVLDDNWELKVWEYSPDMFYYWTTQPGGVISTMDLTKTK